MTTTLEAAAVNVRLRRLWLGEIARSAELAASDLADAVHDVHLRRVGDTLLVLSPYDSAWVIRSTASSVNAYATGWSS